MATITGSFNSLVSGTLSGVIGTPGPTGATGAAGAPGAPGVGVPAAGTTGQVLQKLSATSYDTGWLTLPADFITSVTAPLDVTSGNLSVNLSAYLPLAGGYITGDIQSSNGSGYRSWNGTNLTGIFTAGSIVFNDTTPGHGSLTLDADGLTFNSSPYKQTTPFLGLAGYATEAWVTNGFYPLAGNPSGFLTDAPSNGSQYARKNAAWDVVIPGDRYLTTSTTSNTVSNGNKSFTIGTGLSYTPTQNITISYNAANHMHGEVLTYNSGTGVLTVDIKNHTGSGTYAAWVVNVGGVTPATSVAWGAITGTLSTQTDLQNALDLKLNATTAASTYYLQTNPSGFIGDAPSDGSTYGRNNGAWAVAGGGSYLPLAGGALDANASVTASDTSTATDSELAGWGLGVQLSADHTQGTTVEFNGLDVYNGASHMQLTPTGLTFPDSTTQTTAYTGGVRYDGQGSSGLISSNDIGKLFSANNSTYTFPAYLDNVDFPRCELTFWCDNATIWANFTVSANGPNYVTFKGGITQMYGVGVVKALCTATNNWLIYGDLSWIPYGTVISSSCTSTDGYDSNNVYWNGAWYQSITIWDGAGGTIDTSGYNQGGCFYPAGYCTALGASTDNDSGYVDDGSNIMYYWSYVGATVENGSGGSSTGTVNRPVGSTISNIYTYGGISVYFAADGSGGFVLTNV